MKAESSSWAMRAGTRASQLRLWRQASPSWLGQAAIPTQTGSWSLKLNYQSDAIALSPAGTFVLAGTSGSVQRVSVSPVGVSIDYTVVNGTEKAPPAAGGRPPTSTWEQSP